MQNTIESPVLFLEVEKDQTSLITRFSEKDFLPTAFCRTATNQKSIENSLRKAYNWLKVHNLIREENYENSKIIIFARITKAQTDTDLQEIDYLYVLDGLEIRKLFFEEPIK